MAYDNELADRIRELLAPLRGVDERAAANRWTPVHRH
jgi:hypothetical protein